MAPMNARLLRPRATNVNIATDADARDYIDAVRAADGQYMEGGVQRAIDAFIIGCKADSVWTPIKAACILMGARTLSGALVPLVGSAPTNNGPFVSGDYNRTTGLVGDGVGKYLDSNRANNADGQDDASCGVWLTSIGASTTQFVIGADGTVNGSTHIGLQRPATVPADRVLVRSRNSDTTGQNFMNVQFSLAAGFYGITRSAAGSFSGNFVGNTATSNFTSAAPSSNTLHVFNRNGFTQYATARMAFYWIGSSLTLASLSSRVSTLVTAIGAAIP